MLTPRQLKLLEVIEVAIARDGVAPTQREMARAIGTAVSGVSRLLDKLEERGHIKRLHYKTRAIEVLRPGRASMSAEIKELCDAARSVLMGHAVPMASRLERLTKALGAVEGWGSIR